MMKIPASLISDCQNPFGIRNFDNEHFFARRAGEALQGFNDGKVGHTARKLFGLSRSYLYLLASEGKIRSVSIRKPGATKGRRLFCCASIREFIQASAQNA